MAKLIILSGKSGSGKTYLLNHIVANSDYLEAVKKLSTRPRRPFEIEPIDIITDCSKDEINNCDIVTKTQGYWYGTQKSRIDEVLERSKSPVIITSVRGTIETLKSWYRDAICIHIEPEISEQQMKENMRRQGRCEDEIETRIQTEQNYLVFDENRDILDYKLTNNYDGRFEQDFLELVKDCRKSVFDILPNRDGFSTQKQIELIRS